MLERMFLPVIREPADIAVSASSVERLKFLEVGRPMYKSVQKRSTPKQEAQECL
jgi:hypothetical protein